MRETSVVRLSRLLALVPWLDRQQGVSISDAARHFGVSPEVLERDLWLVVCCGLPGHGPDQLIDIQFWDDDGSIDVVDPQTLQRPLRLTAPEATALLVGLRILEQLPGDHDRSVIAGLIERMGALLDAGPADPPAQVVTDVSDSVRAALQESLSQGRRVRVTYAGVTRDVVTERVVSPIALVSHGSREYLLGFCHEAGAQRTFRVDRILAAEADAERGLTVADAGEMSPIPRSGEQVRLRVDPAARWFIETLSVDDVMEESTGDLVATLTVADPDWLVRTVVGLLGQVEVLAPVSLRAEVASAARAALASLSD